MLPAAGLIGQAVATAPVCVTPLANGRGGRWVTPTSWMSRDCAPMSLAAADASQWPATVLSRENLSLYTGHVTIYGMSVLPVM